MRNSYSNRRSTEVKAVLEDEEVEKTYEFKEVLGKGAFGVVNRAEKGGEEFAVKTLKCVRLQQRKDAEREIAILQQLDDAHICCLKSACRSGRNIFMIMELCTGGELFDKITNDAEIVEGSVVSYMRQICLALQYLHSKNVIHLDLKPENVVIADKASDLVKIIDFGGAQFHSKGKVVRTMFGTREYMAPETLNYDPVEFGTDMWSAGVLCYNLLSGLSPFLGEDDNETQCNIQKCIWDFDCIEFESVSAEAKDFISNLLTFNVAARLTATQCIAHPWLDETAHAQEARAHRSLSITLIGNLKALIARRRWNRAGTAMKALTRLSSFKKELESSDQIPSIPEPRVADFKPSPPLNPVTEEPNQNRNNNLLEQLSLDISRTMKFTPPEPSKSVEIAPSHSKRTISHESTDSGESGISTDNSTASADNMTDNLTVHKGKHTVLLTSSYTRKDSGHCSSGEEEEDIIIIRRSRKRIPLVLKQTN